MEKREITFKEAIREALQEEMKRDESVIIMGIDVGVWGNLYGFTRGFVDTFGRDRVMDTPISEAAIAGCGCGAAASGLRPVIEIMYIDFISIAMDQIINHGAKWHQLSGGKVKVPMVLITNGGVGLRNSSQHSQSFENWFVNVPGLVTVMPSSPYDAKGLLKASIRDDNPVIFIYPKGVLNDKMAVPVEDYLIPLGVADVKRAGSDVSIVATGWMVDHALSAAQELNREGIECEVIDPRTLYPLDEESIARSVHKTGRCMVVTEAPAAGGWSGEVASVVMEHCFVSLKKPVLRLAGIRTGIPYDKDLERQVVPGVKDIIKGVKSLLG
ncbi:MAG: alpha-ketoacid dehydrogenase subunit beta [Atribacterota bacterium]